MQTSCEVRRVLSQNPKAIQPNDFKLQFSMKATKPKSGLTREQILENHKKRRIAWATQGVEGRYDGH